MSTVLLEDVMNRTDQTSEPADALTLPDMLSRAARRFGESLALKEDSLALSYRTLDEMRLRAAAAMLAAGLHPGERIAIWAPNIHEFVIAAAGALSVGAVVVPINTRYKGAEAADILRRSRARWLLTVSGFLGVDYPELLLNQELPDLLGTVLLRGAPSPGSKQMTWSEFLARSVDVRPSDVQARCAAVAPHDIQDILFTSGTTGRSKGVITTHQQNLQTYRAFSQRAGLAPDDRYLIINPFFHAFGYKAGWMSAFMRGACVFPMAVFDPVAAMVLIEDQRISYLPGPPAIFQVLLAHPDRAKYDLSSLKKAVTGAAVIPVDLIRRMTTELRLTSLVTGFGMTETCGTVTVTSPEDDAETVAKTVGRPLTGVEVKIIDEYGQALPAGRQGEVLIRGFNVMQGYLDDAAATREAIDADGWLHSGDIGTLDDRGYLHIVDRLKDMLIVGGFNVYPAEVEQVIARMPGVAQAAVIGIPDERLGEVPKAFVVRVANVSFDAEAVIAHCREHIANFKVPRVVVFVNSLPLNASNKVLKSELRKL